MDLEILKEILNEIITECQYDRQCRPWLAGARLCTRHSAPFKKRRASTLMYSPSRCGKDATDPGARGGGGEEGRGGVVAEVVHVGRHGLDEGAARADRTRKNNY
jgi:hypothetical protein